MENNFNQVLTDDIRQRLSGIRHIALDMDGTIYLGNSLFPYSTEFLQKMDMAGVGYSFLTNNPTKSVSDYIMKLDKMGITATSENMYTTSLAAIDYIRSHYPAARRLFLLGTQSMISQFEQAGYISCEDDADDVPDVVVAAFDPSLVYSRLCRCAWWVSQGVPYIATNPDVVCPTDMRTVLVDCGSICKCIEAATGRRPDVTLGKPDPNMLYGIMDKYGLEKEQVAMVGDRLYTDVATACNAGALGVLVLSGETTRQQAIDVLSDPVSVVRPQLVVRDIRELGELILRSKGII